MVKRYLMKVTCTCIAVVGTLALAAWMAWETPMRVSPGELAEVDVGTLVTMDGTLVGSPMHGGDHTLLRLEDGEGGTAPVFLSFPTGPLHPGTELRVTGRVAIYKGEAEVVVDREDDLVILSKAVSPEVDLVDLIKEPWRFEGMEPRLRVTVMTHPVADLNGEDMWCLVAEPSPVVGSSALALIGPGIDVETWKAGDERDLKVMVQYDASSGFVYLEVLKAS